MSLAKDAVMMFGQSLNHAQYPRFPSQPLMQLVSLDPELQILNPKLDPLRVSRMTTMNNTLGWGV